VQLPEPEEVDEKSAARMAARVKELSEPRLDDAELLDEATESLVAIARRKRERGEDVVEVPEEASEAAPEEGQGGAAVVDLMALLKERMREGAARRSTAGARAKPRTARRAT
jgi:non-homologous end joining protein Ku